MISGQYCISFHRERERDRYRSWTTGKGWTRKRGETRMSPEANRKGQDQTGRLDEDKTLRGEKDNWVKR